MSAPPALPVQWPSGPELVLRAIQAGNEDEVGVLMDEAARNGRALEFTSWARYDGDWDTGGHTLLHWACDVVILRRSNLAAKPSLRIVEELVFKGSSPNARGQGGTLPLQLISKINDDEAGKIIKFLLLRHANPNAVSEYGYTSLHEAAAWGSPIAVQLLIDGGANLNQLTFQGENALVLAQTRKQQANDREAKHRYQRVIDILKEREITVRGEMEKLCSKYKGFFYWGNLDSAPAPVVQMTVADMLNSDHLRNNHKKAMLSNTRWFHLPANNALVGAILTAGDPDKKKTSYEASIKSEVRRIMDNCNTYTRSRHPARSFRAITTQPDGSEEQRYLERYDYETIPGQNKESIIVSFLSVPIIESDIYIGNQDGAGEQRKLPDGVRKRIEYFSLLRGLYPGSVFPKQSLDCFYYEGLDNNAIKVRDMSQVYSKQSRSTAKRILYVGQLWALWIGERTLITASQGDWSGTDIQSPARRYAQKPRARTQRPLDIFYELQELCVDLVNKRIACDSHNGDACPISVHEAFSHEIAEVSEDIKHRYNRYMLHARQQETKEMIEKAQKMCARAHHDRRELGKEVKKQLESEEYDEVFDNIVSEARRLHQSVVDKIQSLAKNDHEKDMGREALDVRDDIGMESERLSQIMDVIDELNIITTVLEEQYEVARWSMSHKDVRDFIRDVRPNFTGLLRESERVRLSVIELLRLREQEIAIRNAVETSLGAEEQASTKIAATVFTVVSFIYTPFSFGFSILGSGIAGMSSEYSIGSAVLAMVLTLIATVALLMFLIPILTVIKKPWSQWVFLVTKATKKVTHLDETSIGASAAPSSELRNGTENRRHPRNQDLAAITKHSSLEKSTSQPTLLRRLISRKSLHQGDPERQ